MGDIIERIDGYCSSEDESNELLRLAKDKIICLQAENEKLRSSISMLEKSLFWAYCSVEDVVRYWDEEDGIPEDVQSNMAWTIRGMRHMVISDEMYDRICPDGAEARKAHRQSVKEFFAARESSALKESNNG